MDVEVEEAVRSVFQSLNEDSSTRDKHLDELALEIQTFGF